MQIDTIFGVKIDPTEAKKGADEVVKQAKRMEAATAKSINTIEGKSKGAGVGFDKMAQGARRAGVASRSAFGSMVNSISLVDGRIGLLIGQVSRMVSSFVEMKNAINKTADGAELGALGFRGMATAATTLAVTIGTLTVVFGVFLAATLAIVAAVKLMTFGFSQLSIGTKLAAEAETAEVQFAVLLGSIEAARDRMSELESFSATTPFQLPEIVEASKTLEIFTQGALATGEGLAMVGDAAAGLNKPIADISIWVGRLYAGLKGGQPIGEATNRLLEMGVFAPSVKGELDKLAESANANGVAFESLWARATQELQKFGGAMQLRSRTFQGLVSTMKDNWNLLRQDIGEPIRDSLKPILEDIISLLGEARSFAQNQVVPVLARLGDTAAATIRGAFSDGNFDTFAQAAADTIKQYFNAAMKTSSEFFLSVLDNVIFKASRTLENGILDAVSNSAWSEALQAGFADVVAAFEADFLGTIQAGLSLLGPAGALAAPALEGLKPGGGNLAAFAERQRQNNAGEKPPEILGLDGLAKVFEESLAPNTDAQNKAAEIIAANTKAIEDQRIADDANINAVSGKAPESSVPGFGALASSVRSKGGRSTRGGGGGTDPLDREANRVLESIKTPTDKFNEQIEMLNKLRDTGRLTFEQYSLAVQKAESDHAKALQNMANATDGFAGRNQSAMDAMMADWGNLQVQIDQVSVAATQSLTGGFSNAISEMVSGTKSAKEAFNDMAASIIEDITRMVTQMLVQYAVQQLVGIATGTGGVSTASVGALVAHGGGTVGEGGLGGRTVPASAFAGAPRYHQGGTVGGVRPGEQAAILQDGEEVLTEGQSDRIRNQLGAGDSGGGNGGQSVQIINVVDQNMVMETIAANPDALINTLSSKRSELRQLVGNQQR